MNIDQKTANGGGVSGVQSEDCLYLNVWAPSGSAAKKLPVIVWIYGGGLTSGGAGGFDGAAGFAVG